MAVAFMVEGMAIHLSMMEPAMSAEWQRAFAREQVDRLVRSHAAPALPQVAVTHASPGRRSRRAITSRRSARS
jgi:hypothetical protein